MVAEVEKFLKNDGNGSACARFVMEKKKKKGTFSNTNTDIEKSARELISSLKKNEHKFFSKEKGLILKNSKVHLDKQNIFQQHKRKYVNMQVQLNTNNQPTTIAVALVQLKTSANNDRDTDLTMDGIRDALSLSLDKIKKCWLYLPD